MDINDITVDLIERSIGVEQSKWAADCHAVSLAIVQSGILGKCRVARGFTRGVMGQHSWVVLGDNCYDPEATILDATLWSYVDEAPTVLVGKAQDRPHVPSGSGNIMLWGKPRRGDGEIIELEPSSPLSSEAQFWLDEMFGPLDYRGWMTLANAPVEGWPSKEIINAMLDTPSLSATVPVDIVGMVTDRNPAGLYL